MYRKVFIALVILLMLINVPVYAEEGIYTLERGKIYVFTFPENNSTVEVNFSDNVLTGVEIVQQDDPGDLDIYNRYGTRRSWGIGYLHNVLYVYNVSDSDVTAVFADGSLVRRVDVYPSPVSLVAYDASEEPIEFTNITDEIIRYKEFSYNEYDNTITYDSSFKSLESGEGVLTFGKGVLLFPINTGNLQYYLSINGVYEVRNYIRKSFFRIPPWILETDLAGIIQALLEQLLMLLPVALVILSVFLLISLIRYIVRLYL